MGGLIVILVVIFVCAVASLVQWLAKTAKQVRAQVSVNSKRDIVQRNEDIIKRILGTIYENRRTSYYVENKVRDCLGEIARHEGRPNLAPQHREWLSAWERRADIPLEYQALKEQLKKTFQCRVDEIEAEKFKREAEAGRLKQQREDESARVYYENRMRDGQTLFDNNMDLVGKFLEITERKVSILDDYGDENWEILDKEIEACLVKIAQRSGFGFNVQEHYAHLRKGGGGYLPAPYTWLREKLAKVFREYHENQRRAPSPTNVNGLDGVDFETHVARQLKACGYDDVRGTPASGDQGADLIAKKDGRTIIIQAKRYQGTVGNKAVQEVASAVSFYGGDEGWVITNSTFTPSARALAQKTNVRLFEGRDLERLAEILSR
jgi:restriction endonuclease Mrr